MKTVAGEDITHVTKYVFFVQIVTLNKKSRIIVKIVS
jgi:hypothetical protein